MLSGSTEMSAPEGGTVGRSQRRGPRRCNLLTATSPQADIETEPGPQISSRPLDRTPGHACFRREGLNRSHPTGDPRPSPSSRLAPDVIRPLYRGSRTEPTG